MRSEREGLRHFLFPPFCYSCGQALPSGRFCPTCEKALARIALPPEAAVDPARVIPRPKNAPEPLDGVRAPFSYVGSARRAILRYKFHGLPEIGAFFAEEMLRIARFCYAALPLGGVVYVPLHPAARRERGFDQAEVLAAEVAKGLCLPLLPLLRKVKNNPPQHNLSAARRQANIRGAYRAEPAEGLQLLLVDDVYTTGATMNACAAVLKRKGAAAVFGLAAAQTPLGSAHPAFGEQEPAE